MEDIDINKLAMLSKLTLSEAETLQVKGRLQKLLSLMGSLKELDIKIPEVVA